MLSFPQQGKKGDALTMPSSFFGGVATMRSPRGARPGRPAPDITFLARGAAVNAAVGEKPWAGLAVMATATETTAAEAARPPALRRRRETILSSRRQRARRKVGAQRVCNKTSCLSVCLFDPREGHATWGCQVGAGPKVGLATRDPDSRVRILNHPRGRGHLSKPISARATRESRSIPARRQIAHQGHPCFWRNFTQLPQGPPLCRRPASRLGLDLQRIH